MATAEIISIGTELLLGEISDANAPYLAKVLNKEGFDIYRITTIGDNVARIAQAMKEALQRSVLVITSGGLGPTVDDPTRQAAALACGVRLIFHEELWKQIEAHFHRLGNTPTENNKQQAYLPETAIAIENTVGTAPAFYIKQNNSLLCCLPGVPSEMEFLTENKFIPLFKQLFKTEAVLFSTIVHTIGIGESLVDQRIGDLEKLKNPTVGLTAHPGRVDIRITAKAKNKSSAIEQINPILEKVQALVGEYIYGNDAVTLQDALCQILIQQGYTTLTFEQQNLPFLIPFFHEIRATIHRSSQEKIAKNQYNKSKYAVLIIKASAKDLKIGKEIEAILEDNGEKEEGRYTFLNSPSDFEEWAKNKIGGLIFKHIKQKG